MSDSTSVAGGVESPSDFSSDVLRWHAELKYAQKECNLWFQQSREILERFKDEILERHDTIATRTGTRFNVLWSNVETLKTAIYVRPRPSAERARHCVPALRAALWSRAD